MRYALLRRTVDIANDAGAYDLATRAIDALSTEYELDEVKLREDALDFADRLAKSPEERRRAVESWRSLAKFAITQDNFASAQRASEKATEIARGLANKVLLKQMVETLDEIKQIRSHADDALAARDQLQANPKDSAAALRWGRFCALYKNDWYTAVPLLAAASGDELCELAKADQQDPRLPAEQAKLGEKWWFAAASQTEPLAKKNMQARAVTWYRRAAPWLDGSQRTALQERIDKFDQQESPFAPGEWVEVLPMIDPARLSVHGSWARQGSELIVQVGNQVRCPIPVSIEGSYDLEVRFTLQRGLESDVMLPVGDRSCFVVVGGWGGGTSGIGGLHGKSADRNESTVKHPPMRVGPLHRLMCRVRPEGDQASIEIDLNSRPLLRWKGSTSALRTGERHPLGLATHQTAIQYHSVRLKLISGKATPL
jgi:hypothetical protein